MPDHSVSSSLNVFGRVPDKVQVDEGPDGAVSVELAAVVQRAVQETPINGNAGSSDGPPQY